jgi:hypothetical protein
MEPSIEALIVFADFRCLMAKPVEGCLDEKLVLALGLVNFWFNFGKDRASSG